jgi:hypothetical protein
MNNSRFLLYTFLLFALAAFSTKVEAQGGDRALISKAQSVSGDRFNFSALTPRGARVYAVNQPNAKTLGAIDDGLRSLFAAARRNGYSRKLNYSDYTIFIARADRTRDGAGNYSPGIAVGAAQYAGTEYDKGGYIYAAGMVLGYNPAAFVIAEHTGNLQGLTDIVRFEGEHIVLYHNDRRLYNQTADHSRGGGHPIIK